jgi:hypothetical protein
MNQIQEFFDLLQYSNKLERNNESLLEQNFELYKVFLNFLGIIEINLHFFEKQKYIELANDFLTHEISTLDFSYYFVCLYEKINLKLTQMRKDESLELANFLTPNRVHLGQLLLKIYGCCDDFSLNSEQVLSDEQNLQNLTKLLLFELQKEENDDSL